MVKKHGNKWTILTQYYPPELGAPQIRLSCLTRELHRYGIDVEVLTAMPNYPAGKILPGYEGRLRMHEVMRGVDVRRVWVYAATGKSARRRLTNYLSFTFTALVSALTGPRPDILFVESQPLSLGIVALAMKWLRGVPYIYNVPDLQVDVARQLGFMRSEWFLHIAFAFENLCLRHSWKVSTVTHRFIEHFQSRGLPREQITFLPNGADAEFLQPRPPDAEMLDRWHLHGKKVFLYVGTHAYYHGLETLIDAATLLQNRHDIVFLLIGDGPERERLKQLAADRGLDNVVFGQSPYMEMDRLYSIAYASIATLRKIDVAKSMRLSKIFPSFSCGVPVVYAGIGEAAELIEHHACGMTVEPERPDLLAQTVEGLADDQGMRDRLAQAGRHLIDRDYAWSMIVARWLEELGVDAVAQGQAYSGVS
jgi:glycosyltransferase involved in cell wall biosynthesis